MWEEEKKGQGSEQSEWIIHMHEIVKELDNKKAQSKQKLCSHPRQNSSWHYQKICLPKSFVKEVTANISHWDTLGDGVFIKLNENEAITVALIQYSCWSYKVSWCGHKQSEERWEEDLRPWIMEFRLSQELTSTVLNILAL